MICRLCLLTINVENEISIFTKCDNDEESQIVKLIAKFFHLEITQHDSISTSICQDCWNHIDEFHMFCIFVNDKQNTLRNEFLEVKCDALLEADAANSSIEQNEESLCDTKDVLQETTQVVLKCEPEEINIFEETAFIHSDNIMLSEDDVPLQELLKRCNKNEKLTKTSETKPTIKIKTATKTKAASKIKTAYKIKTPVRIKNLRSTATTENKIKDVFGNEEKEEHHTTTSANTKEKSKYPKKYPGLTLEDKYNFISENMQMQCDICGESFEKFREVQMHFRAQHKCRAYLKCCDTRHCRLQDIFEHIKWHFDPDFFKCDKCGKLMKNSLSLEVHNLNYHVKEKDLVHKCKYCDKRYARVFLLNHHVRSKHELNRPFVCQHCDKRFSLRNALDTHIQSMHENIFPHICDTCGRKFKFKPSFEKHVLEHQGIIAPPVKCPECGEWVKNKNRLRMHMTSHNKVDVNCKFCGRVCASQSALRAHIQYMHRRPPSNKCSFCEKFFKTPKTLKEHEATHTGKNLYNCPHCIKEFRSSANMYVHIKRQHKQEWLANQVERTKTPPNVENS